MIREEVLKIIDKEKLRSFNWFGDHNIRPNEVVIRKVSTKWSVYTTDERESAISEHIYDSESDALEDFIKRLRANKILSEL
jgi:Immunity protein 59